MTRGHRVFAYCHDSVGIGHLCRTLAICGKVGRSFPSSSFLVATGTPYIALFQSLPQVDYIKLPALKKLNNRTYEGKYLCMDSTQLIGLRQAVLLETIQHYEPDVVLIDKAPVGVRGELVPSLRWLQEHRPGTRVIFGMRDIEDEQAATIAEWAELGVPEILEECYDEIWAYGTQGMFDVGIEYGLSTRIREKIKFMGYVVQEPCGHNGPSSAPRNEIVVTVGGGTDGEFLLASYLEKAAWRASEAGYASVIVGGPDLPIKASRGLAAKAAEVPNVEWVDFESCMNCRLKSARLAVTMGGYNTLALLARNQCPAVVVPRTTPRLEQLMRARLWAQHGPFDVLNPADASADQLSQRVTSMLGRQRPAAPPNIDLGGLERINTRFEHLWQSESERAHPIRV